MAAGTAAALVPIRSILRRIDPASPSSMTSAANATNRVVATTDAGQPAEKVTYVADGVEDAGPACLRLLGQLKGIQSGKVADEFGWCCRVEEGDGDKAEKA